MGALRKQFIGFAERIHEELQLIGFMTAFMRTRENFWIQYQNGVLDRDTWEPILEAIR